ncbi:MAG TPA: hydrogenase formation protein HypD [Symbiobacteriaceae bacterium]
MPAEKGKLVRQYVERIRQRAAGGGRPLRLMEFCGTHTTAISRSGLRSLLAGTVELVSGPGCPVCVTSDWEIDRMLAYSDVPGVILTTYGDLMRVPGSHSSLAERRSEGTDIRVVYSPLDAVAMAEAEPDRPVIFLGVGFETTAPATALAIREADRRKLTNFFVHSAHKATVPAIRALLGQGGARLDGLLCPGHVSTVIGSEAFRFLPEEFGLPAAVGGFEPLDLVVALDYLVEAALGLRPVGLYNGYSRWVRPEGNERALALLRETFELREAQWRGLGTIPESGMGLRGEYRRFDAEVAFPATVPQPVPRKGCRCGDVLRGELIPSQCPLFSKVCTPSRPYGPCMVSGEGACAAFYRYGGEEAPVEV